MAQGNFGFAAHFDRRKVDSTGTVDENSLLTRFIVFKRLKIIFIRYFLTVSGFTVQAYAILRSMLINISMTKFYLLVGRK